MAEMADVSSEFRIPLIRALRAGKLDVARALCERVPEGADLGESPTLWAVNAGSLEGLKVCIDHFGPHPHEPGRSGAMHLAAFMGNADAICALLDAAASPDETDQDGRRPLGMAAEGPGYEERARCVELLLAAGANPDARDNLGRTALMTALDREDRMPLPNLARASIDGPTALDKEGRTALDRAQERGAGWALPSLEAKLLDQRMAPARATSARRL